MFWVHSGLDLVGFRRREFETGDRDIALVSQLGDARGHQPHQDQLLAGLESVHQLHLLTRPDPELAGGAGGVVRCHPGHLATQRLQSENWYDSILFVVSICLFSLDVLCTFGLIQRE